MTTNAIDPSWGAGFPPPVAERVRFADGSFYQYPQLKWSFNHIEEVVPTRSVWRGPGAAVQLPSSPVSFDDLAIEAPDGASVGLADMLERAHTDAFAVLHRGKPGTVFIDTSTFAANPTYVIRYATAAGNVDIPCGQPVAAPLVQTVAQSSTRFGGAATRAFDGDTSGVYREQSVSHTANENQPWWQVDFGATLPVSEIAISNRTDCCADRLSNFYVFVSEQDMSTQSLADLIADPAVQSFHHPDVAGTSVVPTQDWANGRYVMVRLAGVNPLSLAEVEIVH